MATWLILDTNYLAWRAFHTTGKLSHEGVNTGVIYGVCRDIISLQELHDTKKIVFCFDYSRKDLLRRVDYPGYKGRRDSKVFTEDEQEAFDDVQRQIRHLRTIILPKLGYKNIFCEKGYESDDCIASVVNNLDREDECIIVSADHDLYQLLSHRTFIWNPTAGKIITATSFSKQYGITPTQWLDVKAIAGCNSDDIIGIRGIGEKTAAKFLNGSLKSSSAAFKKIIKGNKIWKKNKPIVKIPYPGTPEFKVQDDSVSKEMWDRLANKLGMRSLYGLNSGSSHGKGKEKKKTKSVHKGFLE